VNSLHGLLNCEISGLDCRVITTEYRTRVHCIHMYHLFCNALVHVIYSRVSGQCSHTIPSTQNTGIHTTEVSQSMSIVHIVNIKLLCCQNREHKTGILMQTHKYTKYDLRLTHDYYPVHKQCIISNTWVHLYLMAILTSGSYMHN